MPNQELLLPYLVIRYLQLNQCTCVKTCVFSLRVSLNEVVTWVVRMRTTLLSYSGPGVMLPSCVFRGGQRLTLPETCSACAHTGSQSTATSTTIRYINRTRITVHPLMFLVVDTSPGAEGQCFPVWVCLCFC